MPGGAAVSVCAWAPRAFSFMGALRQASAILFTLRPLLLTHTATTITITTHAPTHTCHTWPPPVQRLASLKHDGGGCEEEPVAREEAMPGEWCWMTLSALLVFSCCLHKQAARHLTLPDAHHHRHPRFPHHTPDTSCVAARVPKVGRFPAGVSRSYTSVGEAGDWGKGAGGSGLAGDEGKGAGWEHEEGIEQPSQTSAGTTLPSPSPLSSPTQCCSQWRSQRPVHTFQFAARLGREALNSTRRIRLLM